MSDFPFLQSEKCNPYARTLWDEAMLAKPIEWLVNDLIASGSFNLFCGDPKSGKTFFLMEMGLCVATGQSYLNMPSQRRPVYYCFLEDAPQVIRNRAKALGGLTRMSPNDKYMFYTDYGIESVKRGLDWLKEEQGLLIIDPLAELFAEKGFDENKAPEVLKIFKEYRDLCHSIQGSIVIAHHYNKGGERMRGSTAMEGGIDGWVNVKKQKGEKKVHLDWTMRMGESSDLYCRRYFDQGQVKFEVLKDEETQELYIILNDEDVLVEYTDD